MIRHLRGAASIVLSLAMTTRAALAAEKPIVEIEVTATPEDESEIERAVQEVGARLGVTVVAHGVREIDPSRAGAPGRLLHIGIASKSAAATIIVTDGRTGKQLATREVFRTDSRDVFFEELSLVVEATIEPSVLAERDREVLPPAPRVPAPVAPSERSSAIAFDVDASGGVSSFGAIAGARAGAGATIASRRGLRPALGLSAAYLFPFDAGGSPVVSVRGAALRLRPELTFLHSDVWSVGAGPGIGIDVLNSTPRSTDAGTALGPATTRVDPIASATATGRLGILSRVALSLTVGVDVDLAQRRYVVERGPDRADVFAPARVRPVALLGVTVSMLGEPLFASTSATEAQ